MIYIFLIPLLLTPIAIVAALIYAYKKLSRSNFLLLLLVMLLLVAAPFAAFKIYERNFLLSFIPDALGVHSISYREEESWGFGPGGNEAGIRVYPLSKEIASQITDHGIAFLHNMPPNQHQRNRRWQGDFSNWSETPIKPGHHWMPNEKTKTFNIYDYICAYGFCIDIKPEIVEEANWIINSPGSYYAYGRIGVIIVSSERKMILYLYNG